MNRINKKLIELSFLTDPNKLKTQIEIINSKCKVEITDDSVIWIKNELTDFTGGYDVAVGDPISKVVILAMALIHPSLWSNFYPELVNETSNEWGKQSQKTKKKPMQCN
jgi:hypothetical protein